MTRTFLVKKTKAFNLCLAFSFIGLVHLHLSGKHGRRETWFLKEVESYILTQANIKRGT